MIRATPIRARRAGVSEPGQRASIGYPGLGERAFVSSASKPPGSAFIAKRGAKIFQGLQDLLRYQMLDLLMIALGVGFFVASVLYVLACERM